MAATFTQEALPWTQNKLEPKISEKTIGFHYGKHHAGYVNKLNAALAGTIPKSMKVALAGSESKSGEAPSVLDDPRIQNLSNASNFALEDDEQGLAGITKKIANCAGQHWNHTFYWQCMREPVDGNEPDEKSDIGAAINTAFGSFDKFKQEFAAAAGGLFGSGWAWLVFENNTLVIQRTSNAGCPFKSNAKYLEAIPILVCDVWEHAYYVDYQNKRGDYVKAFFDLINWDFVNTRYTSAKNPTE